MVLKKLIYRENGKTKMIKVLECKNLISKATGLMFKKSSPPLLFIFQRQRPITIHSFFCKPFRAMWLDKNMNVLKSLDIYTSRLFINGTGMFLLEIPLYKKTDGKVKNRKV